MTHTRRPTTGLFLLFLVCVPSAALADSRRGESRTARADEAAFDEHVGREPRRFPPDPVVDFQHVVLDIRMEKPATRAFECVETILFKTLAFPLERLELDAVELQIAAVSDLNDAALAFRYDDRRLSVRFSNALPAGAESGIRIRYRCENPQAGMIFALPDAGYPKRALMVHTQGQSDDSRYWFVCHDFPNERFTSEIIATVPSELSVIANGRLLERRELGDGLAQHHFKLDQSHPSYLVSLVVGQFATAREVWRGKPIEYYVPPQDAANIQRTFHKTPLILELFSNLLGMEYPYDKYAQVAVHLFEAGGMENTSATTLYEDVCLDERAALELSEEDLIAHEAAHQWFGDAVSYRSWAHVWLGEGFATYLEWVWHEHESGRAEYEYGIWKARRDVAGSDGVQAAAGLVVPFYQEPDDIFVRPGSNPYSKGSVVVHMLRAALGDDVFWHCIREFLRRHAWSTVETDDLRRVIEEISGRSFERFFYQWLNRPGTPHVRVQYAWDDAQRELTLRFEQTQPVTRAAPAFDLPIEIWLLHAAGEQSRHLVRMDERQTAWTRGLPVEPAQVLLDPRAALLWQVELQLPTQMLLRQCESGPTMFARLQAAQALLKQQRADVLELLRRLLVDESQFWGLRSEIAAGLGRMQAEAARDVLLDSLQEGQQIQQHRVRKAAVEALAQYRDARVTQTLLRLAKRDATYGVEAAATLGLASQEPSDEIRACLLANADRDSHRDVLRVAAVQALAQIGETRGLEPAMRLGAYGGVFQNRPRAIRAVGLIGKKLQDAAPAREFLLRLIDDPQQRSAVAAMQALGELADEQALEALERLAAGSATAARRDAARAAIDAIHAMAGADADVAALRERVKQLEDARREMQRALQQATDRRGEAP